LIVTFLTQSKIRNMMAFGKIVALAVVVCWAAQIFEAQSKAPENAAPQSNHDANAGQDLKMTRIGHGKLRSGHYFGFRIYEAQSGSEGEVTYATLPTIAEAKQQIDEWLAFAEVTKSREHDLRKGTKLVSDRILGSRDLVPKDPKKTPKATEFLIIRRDGANCYFIQSIWLDLATKIEDLID
jgi:hypothetical protein